MKLYVSDPVISVRIGDWYEEYDFVGDIPLEGAEKLADELCFMYGYEHERSNPGDSDVFANTDAPSISFENNGTGDTHKAVIDYIKEMLP